MFVFQKYSKFWSISIGHFIKHKPLISEECLWASDPDWIMLWFSLISSIFLYFQSFDHEKYKFIQIPELQNNNHPRSNRTSNKTSLSLAGLRIDERGGIYLNPLLDSNSAYFKCYVAEEVHSGDLIGM